MKVYFVKTTIKAKDRLHAGDKTELGDWYVAQRGLGLVKQIQLASIFKTLSSATQTAQANIEFRGSETFIEEYNLVKIGEQKL